MPISTWAFSSVSTYFFTRELFVWQQVEFHSPTLRDTQDWFHYSVSELNMSVSGSASSMPHFLLEMRDLTFSSCSMRLSGG